MNNNKLLLFGCGLLASATVQAQEAQKPNIIYIMCDDLGYADVGCYGQQYISTPNLDRMAAEGMRFTQAYAGSPVSAPSRATFMTGQHTGHTHVRGNKEYWPNSGSVTYGKNTDYARVGQEPYTTDHKIIPEIMKAEGYTTGMFGKWAGGYEGSQSTPDKRGIDEYYGFICQFQAHLYYPNFLNAYSRDGGDTEVRREILENNINYAMHGNDYKNRKDYSADLIHQRAMAWIDKQTNEKPFLGIFTYTLPHAELAQPEDSIFRAYQGTFCTEKSYGGDAGSRYNPTDCGHQQFAAMVTRLDTYVGEILDKLKEKGFDKNTLVLFTSDNGPHTEGGADPDYFNTERLLRGTKRSTTEGGIRVPFIAWWPGVVEAGSVNDHQLAFYDMMPTFCELAGVENYVEKYKNPNLENDYFDGISIVPTLIGKGQQEKHEFLYWEFHETDMMALRMDNWKLVVEKGNCYLYDLANDLHEDKNIASQYPEIVDKMKTILKREHTNSSLFQVTLPQ
ncbi:MAG: arylsulfatase [Bacteroidaceae bacterium]|nr:arylsulfatase [Bacteroidaceae bacterium]